jgi:hypothetical protein
MSLIENKRHCVRHRTACHGLKAHTNSYKSLYYLSEIFMFETIAILLLVLWALGLVTSYTLGGFIHVLLLLALIVIAIRIIQGRRVV